MFRAYMDMVSPLVNLKKSGEHIDQSCLILETVVGEGILTMHFETRQDLEQYVKILQFVVEKTS